MDTGGGGGGSGTPPPPPDGDDGGMMAVDGMEELREQALGLISDAQTAMGDRREKEALLKQVEELVLHRAPGLLDEVVPTLIAEFQADPAPGVRKVLAEILENVVKAHPSFCQPGMVDVYSHALQYEDSPLVIKRVLVAATNVHRVVLRYAALSGLAQIWTDYCRRVKAPVLAMKDDAVRMADVGIAQGVIKFLEGCIFTGAAPARSSAVASRADDSFTVADLVAAYDAQTQELFGVEEMRQEAQELLGQSLLGWLSHGHAAFTKPPHWSFLINTLSSIATHRVQFLPLIAGTLGGLLAARFSEEESEEEAAMHAHLHLPAVTQVLKSACLKLARLSATRAHPLALEALGEGLKAAGMEAELKALGPHLPESLRGRLLEGKKEESAATTAASEPPAAKRPRRSGRGQQEGEGEGDAATSKDPRRQRQQQQQKEQGEEQQEGEGEEVEKVVPPELMAVPPQWYKTNAPERAAFVLSSLALVPLPPAPFRDPRLVLPDPDALVLRLANALTSGQPAQGLEFVAEVAASSRQEMPMDLAAGGMGNEALTELIVGAPGASDDEEDDEGEGSRSRKAAAAHRLTGSGIVGEEALKPLEWAERRRLQELGAVDRLLWGAEGQVEGFGAGGARVAVVSRLLCLLGGSAALAPPSEEEAVRDAGPTLPQQQPAMGGEGGKGEEERRRKANVAAIAALASTQGAIGHALSYLVEDYGARREIADRLLYELFLRGLMEQGEEQQEEGEDEHPGANKDDDEEEDEEAAKQRETQRRRQKREAERRRARKGMELYDVVFLALCRRLVARLDGRDKEKLLTTAYLTAPRLPSRALDLLSECLEDNRQSKAGGGGGGGGRVMQGLMTLVELAVYRPMAQEDCLARVLQAAIHPNAEVRRQAIHRAVLKRLYRIEELKEGIEAFARAQLDAALQPPPQPSSSSSRSSKRSKATPTDSKPSMTKEEEEEDVKRRIYLYLSLCAKNEALVGGVFEAYAAAAAAAAAEEEGGGGGGRGAVAKGVLEGEMEAFVKHVVTPHGAGSVLSSLVGAPPLASPLILTVLNLLVPETQARPRPPPPEVVAAAKSLRELRGGDVSYLLPVLGGLTREEMEKGVLPPLMEGDRVDERLLKRMIIPYGPLSNAEALVALHNVDPEAAEPKIPLKKYLDTLQKCLGMKALFPQTALTLALVKMVEDKATPVPTAYMRSVILAIRMYPSLKAVVADAIVPKLVEREIWAAQPRVWEGMVLLPKYVGAREVTDKMAEALLLLPAPQLQDLIKKNPDMRAVLVTHVTRAKKQASLDAAKRKALGL